MKIPDKIISQIPWIQDADAYFCFIRSWWDGAGIDAAIWCKHETKYYLRIIKTGETVVRKPPVFDESVPISAEDFNQVQNYALGNNFESINSQLQRITYTNYDSWYGLKTNFPGIEHWIFVRGSKHADKRVMDLLYMVLDKAPKLYFDADD
jgi:hypothetical protein